MRVSQRLDYALRTLVLLAQQPPEDFVAAGDLAERLRLPRRFVEQQITVLARADIVDCRRGAQGGCRLARPAASVSVRDVVIALHGDVLDVPRLADSATTEVWTGAADALGAYLEGVALAELAARQRELDAHASPMYYI